MIYLLFGENSPLAIKKIQELKAAFVAKNGNSFSLEDVDCREEMPDNFFEVLGSSSLFNKKRLVVIRGVLENNPALFEFFKKEFPRMQESGDVFVFWESALKEECLEIFKNHAQKIQEFRVSSELVEQKNDKAVFGFVDQIFSNRLRQSIVSLLRAKEGAIDEAEIMRVILWKLKNMFLVKKGETKAMHPYVAKKTAGDAALFTDTQLLDTFWGAIFVDSNLKRDSKNGTEHTERFLLETKNRII